MRKTVRAAALVAWGLASWCCGSPPRSPVLLSAEIPIRLEEHLEAASIVSSIDPARFPPPGGWFRELPLAEWRPSDSPSLGAGRVEVRPAAGGVRFDLPKIEGEPGYAGGISFTPAGFSELDWAYLQVRARFAEPAQRMALFYDDGAAGDPLSLSALVQGDRIDDLAVDGSWRDYLIRTAWIQEPGETPSRRRLHLVFTSAGPTAVELRSISLVSREAACAGAATGVRMEIEPGRGLDWDNENVFRRIIFVHAPGRIAFRIKLPEEARLDLGLGIVRDCPGIEFRVELAPENGDPATLLEAAPEDRNRWDNRSLDLSAWAGATATLTLITEGPPGAVGLWIAPLLGGRQPEESGADAARRILLIGDSEFGRAGGGSLTALIEGFFRAAGRPVEASRQDRFIGSGRVPMDMRELAVDDRIASLIARGGFDDVVFTSRNFLGLDEGNLEDIPPAFARFHDRIVGSGARPVLYIPYAGRDEQNRVPGVLEGFREIRAFLESRNVPGTSARLLVLPVGEFLERAVERWGLLGKPVTIRLGDRPPAAYILSNLDPLSGNLYSDAFHGTRLAKYAVACMIYAFLADRDPRDNSFVDNTTPEQSAWIKETVWELLWESR